MRDYRNSPQDCSGHSASIVSVVSYNSTDQRELYAEPKIAIPSRNKSNPGEKLYNRDMDQLKDILIPKKFQEPPEIKRIKTYIRTQFKADASITTSEKQLTILVKSAALAGTLRLHSHQMSKACRLDKRLVIRIG